jgi:hypothetical protein
MNTRGENKSLAKRYVKDFVGRGVHSVIAISHR